MAFYFPDAVTIPKTKIHVRTDGAVTDLDHVDHSVFYIRLAEPTMVRSQDEVGLIVRFGSGPGGAPPKDFHWMWGVWGRLCLVPNPDGTWHSYQVGPIAYSLL